MTRYEVSARSAAPAEIIYALLLTPGTWPAWSPVDAAEVEEGDPDVPQEAGAVRVFRTGRTVSRERITALTPGRRMEYGGGALRDYRAAVELTPLPDGGTRIDWSGTFRGNPLWKAFLTWHMGRMARGLAAYAERLER
jgi:Polyketide cyclase / dehydrase and lipid transport